MIDYNVLNIGLQCADREELSFCYEAVKEDFFDEITDDGFYIESESSDSQEIKAEKKKLQKLKKLSKKRIAAIATALVAFGALIVALKKTAPERAKKLSDKIKDVDKEFAPLRQAEIARSLTNKLGRSGGNSEPDPEYTKAAKAYSKKIRILGWRLSILCGTWKIPMDKLLFEEQECEK